MQINHPTMGSPSALVTPQGELVTTGSRSFDDIDMLGGVQIFNSLTNGNRISAKLEWYEHTDKITKIT